MFWPHMPDDAVENLAEVLKTRWLGQGPKVDEFERIFSKKFNIQYALSMNSCTSALHLSMVLAGLNSESEVIAPVLTCAATNIPILYTGSKIVFVDIQPETLNIDYKDIEKKITKKTKAIIVVHWCGYPCDMDEILEIAKRNNLFVIEDAAHALGAKYKDRYVGTLGDFTCFSFQAIKQITTGDGGMLALKSQDFNNQAKRRRWYGIDREKRGKNFWEYDIYEVGYKYHMNDIAAILGICQMRKLDEILKKRKQIVDRYLDELSGIPGLTLLKREQNRESANWLFALLVENREGFMKKLKENGIESSLVHLRCDTYTIFGGKKQDLPNMNALEEKYISIPLHNELSEDDVGCVIKTIRSGW